MAAPRDPHTAAHNLEQFVAKSLKELRKLKTETLVDRRYEKFRNLGVVVEKAAKLGGRAELGRTMSYTGTVLGGWSCWRAAPSCRKALACRVEPAAAAGDSSRQPHAETLGERLLRFAGTAAGLPADLAESHDHYIHGTPRNRDAGGK